MRKQSFGGIPELWGEAALLPATVGTLKRHVQTLAPGNEAYQGPALSSSSSVGACPCAQAAKENWRLMHSRYFSLSRQDRVPREDKHTPWSGAFHPADISGSVSACQPTEVFFRCLLLRRSPQSQEMTPLSCVMNTKTRPKQS